MSYCRGDTTTIYNLSDNSLKYDAIFDKLYATTLSELYAGTMTMPYTKVILVHYQTLFKKGTTWKIDLNNPSAINYKAYCYYF